jgi:hypothetical protein
VPTTLGRWAGRARPQRDACRERGQVLILFVMGATVIFAIGAIVVDIGLWVSERRSAQAAADLAALAAATQLRDPSDPNAAAIAKGLDFAKRNGYDTADSRIRVGVFPDLPNDTVKVEIEEHGGSLFAGIFGITNMDVGATAVGKYVESPPGPGWALFVRDQSCSRSNTLDYQADDSTVDGAVQSNATIQISGNNNSFNGPVNWVCPNGLVDSGRGNTYQPNPSQAGIQTPPINYSYGSFGCTAFVSNPRLNDNPSLWVGNDPNTRKLIDNVICSTGDLTLDTSDNTGRVTLVARGKVTIDGSNNDLDPSQDQSKGHNVLAYSEALPNVARDAIEITASGGRLSGYIHAPNSEAEITGYGDVTIAGSVVADTIRIRGDHLNFNASGYLGPKPPPNIHLED